LAAQSDLRHNRSNCSAPRRRPIPATPDRSIALPPSQRTLLRLLDSAFGDDHSGRVLIHAALRAARRSSLPVDGEQLLDFVRAYLVGPLTEELGARVVTHLLDDLAGDVMIPSGPPSAPRRGASNDPMRVTGDMPTSSGVRVRASVVLLDGDRFARASLARSLVSTGCDVAVADGPLDLRSLDGRVDVAIVNMTTSDVAALLGALIAKEPEARVIAMTNDTHGAETLLRAVGVRVSRVVPKTMRVSELGELVRRLAVRA
jgi:hypothetical protein